MVLIRAGWVVGSGGVLDCGCRGVCGCGEKGGGGRGFGKHFKTMIFPSTLTEYNTVFVFSLYRL